MPDANSRYDVKVEVVVTDVTPGKDSRVEFEDTCTWRGVNYGALVGLEDALQGTMNETVGWGKAMAEVLGQPVPSDAVKKPVGKK